MIYLKKISCLLVFFLLFSCYESLDFDQLDDYVSKPVFTSALTFFSVTPIQFFNSSGVQQESISDVSVFEPFRDEFVRDNVVKIDFNAEYKNELDRGVIIQVDFLDDSNRVTYSFQQISVESEDVNPPAFSEEIIIASHLSILNTTKVRIHAEIESTGTPLNINDTREFEFKSSVTFYIESDI